MENFDRFAQFPFGGVYYRVSNPPREDWERDYRQYSSDGMNTFRHWFLWSAIETAPERFNWEPYDRQLELGAKYGIKAIIAEITHSAPQWAYTRYRSSLYEDQNGHKFPPVMMESTGTGGYYGLCLDNDDALDAASRWLTALATRYKGHPGLGGYDIYNESNLFSCQPEYCHCAGTKAKFRQWLQNKYGGDVRVLSDVWQRYGFTDWDQVDPPVLAGPYPDFMDWVRFRADDMYRLIKWRIDTIKAADPDAVIACHATDDCSLYRHVDAADDVWRSAEHVEIMGYTGGNGNRPDGWDWQRWLHGDLTRSGCGGRPFWACELAAGPSWKTIDGRPREERIPSPGQVRSSEFAAMAVGVSGILNCRMRPLQNGHVAGSFAYYDTDGTVTDRSEAASRTAKWANDPKQKPLFGARPVPGDIAILFEPDSEIFLTLLYGTNLYHTNSMGPWNYRYDPAKLKPMQDYASGIDSTSYANAVRGVYQAFADSNIQADFVKKEDLEKYKAVYVPCPLMLPADTVAALCEYVKSGGCLISEGAPAYYDERGFIGNRQPCDSLAALFGAKQSYIEFLPDLLEKKPEPFCVRDIPGIPAGLYIQKYTPAEGRAAGEYTGLGGISAVENVYGKGRTLLLGTSPGMGYWHHKSGDARRFFSWLLEWGGIEQRLSTNSRRVMARLHEGGGYTSLWIVNNSTDDVQARVTLSSGYGNIRKIAQHTGLPGADVSGRTVSVFVPRMDAFVAGLFF